MLPAQLQKAVEAALARVFHTDVAITHASPVGGGCINRALRIETTTGIFFVKANDAALYPGIFETEAMGLALLAATGAIATPQVIATGATPNDSFLVLEFIQPAPREKLFWDNFGSALARLHRATAPRFGLEHDNYIGSLPQVNTQHDDFISFFIHQRLHRQVQRALQNNLLSASRARQFEHLYAQLPQLLPSEPPALLHGDLWSGNFIIGSAGEAVLIDPAVHYGHREAELAFTRLFGGFDARFYAAYHAAYPLLPGFEQRTDIYNLYPLLVHVNLFGGGYVQSVERILEMIA